VIKYVKVDKPGCENVFMRMVTFGAFFIAALIGVALS
jgi:hypothetical protein